MNKAYIRFVDYLNIAACIAVVLLHTNGCFWRFSYEKYWETSVVIETLFYWAVPIFFMIIGITLFDYRKKYDTRTYFYKRWHRGVFPFLLWSVIGIIFQIGVGHLGIERFSFISIIDMIVNTHITGIEIYWFFIPLFAVYLSLPCLTMISDSIKRNFLNYLTIYAFITISVLPCLFQLAGIKFNGSAITPVSGGYLLYVFLGYLLFNYYNFSFRQRVIIYILGIGGWFIRFYTVLAWSLAGGKIDNTLGGYLNFPTVLFSIAVFIFFQYDLSKFRYLNRIPNQFIREISGASLGVYLIHIYFVRYLPQILMIPNTSIWWRTFGAIGIYLLCVCVVIGTKRIPYLKNIFP